MSRKSKAAEFLQEGYNISITGRNVLITDAMKDYAIEKLSKIEKFSHRIIDVSITMDIQKGEHRVDIVMKVDNIKVKSHGSSNEMYASIDMAVDKIQRQLLRYKSRIQDHQARARSELEMLVNVVRVGRNEDEFDEFDLEDFNADIEAANAKKIAQNSSRHYLVSQEKRPLKVLTPDEALMQIDLSGDAFLIFVNEETQKLSVLYKRKDGHFGIIEPEKR